jgi:hypothetical protein
MTEAKEHDDWAAQCGGGSTAIPGTASTRSGQPSTVQPASGKSFKCGMRWHSRPSMSPNTQWARTSDDCDADDSGGGVRFSLGETTTAAKRRVGMSYDPLMRWESEGGAVVAVNEDNNHRDQYHRDQSPRKRSWRRECERRVSLQTDRYPGERRQLREVMAG